MIDDFKAKVKKLCENVLDTNPDYDYAHDVFSCIECLAFIAEKDTKRFATRREIFKAMNHQEGCFIGMAEQILEELENE